MYNEFTTFSCFLTFYPALRGAGAPHALQNFAPGLSAVPHPRHTTGAGVAIAAAVPHT